MIGMQSVETTYRNPEILYVQLVQLRVLVAGTRYIHGIRTTEH